MEKEKANPYSTGKMSIKMDCLCHAWIEREYVMYMKGSVKEPNKFHNCEAEKITCKASDAAEYIELLVLPPEIIMHDAFNAVLWTSPDICTVHDNLGWKNWTEQLNIIAGFQPYHWLYEWFRPPKTSANICVVHDNLGWKNRTTCNRFWRAGCSW